MGVRCCCLAAITFADPVAVIYHKVFGCQHLRRQPVILVSVEPPNGNFHGAYVGCLTVSPTAGINSVSLPLRGAFSWHKRYRNVGESFAVPGHISRRFHSSRGNDSAFNRRFF